jgi:long-chain acyl-CoA synthetase
MAAIAHPEKSEFLPFGEVGELVVKGPQLMKGYWKLEAETGRTLAEIMGEKWVRTGDLALIDDEGYFHFYDRKRDCIICGGQPVFAREVEEVIKTHRLVREAAVIGATDQKGSVVIKAVIILRGDARGKLSDQDIISHCRGRLDEHKIPGIIEFRGEIPKTDVGKVSRRELREEKA